MGNHATTSESEEITSECEKEPVYFIPGTDQDFINKFYHDELHKANVTIANLSNQCFKLLRQVTELEIRLNKVERTYDVLGRRLEGAERHPEDEGWFD